MNNLTILIKPASSLCNLHCKYCFYNDVANKRENFSNGTMTKGFVDILVLRIKEELNGNGEVNIAFQGGEPTMAGLEWFEYFVSKMKEHPTIIPYYSLQTNTTLLDEAWMAFFKKYNFLIGVSVDGFQANTDLFRYDIKHHSVYKTILKNIELLKHFDIDFNILIVITKNLAKYPNELFEWAKNHNLKYLQFIPCLPNLEEKENEISLTPQDYASFYKAFFRVWKENALKGNFISINLFDNLAGMLKGIPPYQCGMLGECSTQFVIEANGDVFPCDFYCLDHLKMGNLKDLSFEQIKNSTQSKAFIKDSDCKNGVCKTCPYISICNGGCKRQNVCYLEENYCGYQDFLNEIIPELYKLLR